MEKVIETITGIGYQKFKNGREKERRIIKNYVFTDGTVTENETLPRIDAEGELTKLGVEEIEHKIIKIKDASYIIVLTTQKEERIIGNICGIFDVTQSIKIFKNKEDKNADENIISTFKYISKSGKRRDYSSIKAYARTYGVNVPSDYERVGKNIFILKK